MKLNLESADIHLIVESTFQKAIISGRKINDCTLLSSMIEERVGRRISPTTIYRMCNIDRYKTKPYDYTIRALLDFLEVESINELRDKSITNSLETPSNITQSPLSILLMNQLQKERYGEIKGFLSQLPNQYFSLGFEQLVIAATFGNYFRGMEDSKRRLDLIKFFSDSEQFHLYFFHSFPDLDFRNEYFYEALRLSIQLYKLESVNVFLTNNDLKSLSRKVYEISLFIFLASISNRTKDILDAGGVLFGNKFTLNRISEFLDEEPTIKCRLLNAQLIYLKVSGKKCDPEIVLRNFVEELSSSYEGKIFKTTILADNLVLMGEPLEVLSPLLQDSNLINEAMRNCHYEPNFYRFLVYSGFIPVEKVFPLPLKFVYGQYELKTSKQLINRYINFKYSMLSLN